MEDNRKKLFEIMEKINPDFSIPSFTILVGISGSGKSTWIKSNNTPNTTVISFDEIRQEINGNINDHTNNLKIIYIGLDRIVNELNAGKNVILDATNVESRNRKNQLNYIKERVKRPFKAYAKIFYADPKITKERIKNDIEKGINRSNVPFNVVDKQYNNFINDIDKIESDGYEIIKENVKKYLGDDFNPNQKYYHYSDNLFNKFIDQTDLNYKRKHSLTNRGIYFHESPPMYKYGKNKYEVRLNIKKPFIIKGKYISDVVNPLTNKRIEIEHINEDDIKYLTNLGYDAVVGKFPSYQTVVFKPEQIRIIKINDKDIEEYLTNQK